MAQTVNFFQPGTEAAIDQGQIARQRELAMLLQKQGMTPQQGQMVSGHYVAPSPWAYAAQLASALAGSYKANQADEREQTLVRSMQAQRSKDVSDFMEAGRTTPAVPARDIQPLTPNDDEGNPMPAANVPAQAARAPDMNRQIAIALNSQVPGLQSIVPDMLKRQQADSSFDATWGGGAGGGGAPTTDGGGAPSSGGGSGFIGEGYGQIPVQIARLLHTKGPDALAQAVLEARKPIALREGDLVAPNGLGGVTSRYSQPKLSQNMQVTGRDAQGQPTGVGAIPGAPGAVSALAGAQATAEQEAKSATTLRTIEMPGGPVTKTEAEWRKQPGVGSAPAAPRPAPRISAAPAQQGGVQPRGAFTGTGEQVMAAIDAAQVPPAVKDEMRRAYAAQMSDNNPPFDAMGTGALPQTAAPAAPTAPGGGIVGVDPAAAEYDKTRAKDFAAQAAEFQKNARSASGTLRNLDQLEALYKDPNIAKGGAAEEISALKNLATSAGVDVKGLGAEQGIQAITNKMALEARSTAEGAGMPGAMSDADRNFLKNMQPGLSKSPEGRATIIDASRKLAQRQVQAARLANQYERTHGRIDAGFDRELADFAAKNEMFSGQKAQAAPAGADYRSLAAQELERRRKGAK